MPLYGQYDGECATFLCVATDDFPLPSTTDAITPAWLTTVLREAGAVARATVVAFRVQPIGTGSGFVGQTARLHLEYDVKESGAPATLFAKLSSADPTVRAQLRRLGVYEAEAGFYRDLARLSAFPLCVPRPYLSLHDNGTGASILLLEDLGQAEFGDNLAGCSPMDAEIAVRQLGRLHAHFWGASLLAEFSWLRGLTDDAEARVGLYRAMLPRFEQRCAGFVMPSLLQTARKFADILPTYCEKNSSGPKTLVHGDFRADNMAFTGVGDERFMVLFDWQVARRSHGPRDLAYFLASSLSVERRRTLEGELLKSYYETLTTNGVDGYSEDDLRRDVQAGMGAPLTTLVIAGGMLDFSSERGTALFRQLCERAGTVLNDHQFAAYVDELASAAF